MTLFDWPEHRDQLDIARRRDAAIARSKRAPKGDKLRSQGEVRAWTRRLLEEEVRDLAKARLAAGWVA